MPAHEYAVVVDHGYTFANDASGARFTPQTARAFAAERNAELRQPTYAVYMLAPDTEPACVVTFDPREISGPGAIAGLREMTLADAREVIALAARIPKHGRIVDARTLQVIT